MKSIIVLSDSHGMLPKDDNFWTVLDEADYIFHLGDGINEINTLKSIYKDKFYYVYGNCDTFNAEPFKIVEVEGVKFLLTHGNSFGVKHDLYNLAFECKYQNIKYGLYGHTHIAKVDEIDGVTLINPGSICYERSYCYIAIQNKNLVYKIVQQ